MPQLSIKSFNYILSCLFFAIISVSCQNKYYVQTPGDKLHPSPEFVETDSKSIRFASKIVPAFENNDAQSWIAVVPPGDIEVVYHSLLFEDPKTGNIIDLVEYDFENDRTVSSSFSKILKTNELGYWKNHRLFNIIAEPKSSLYHLKTSWTLNFIDIELIVDDASADTNTKSLGEEFEEFEKSSIGQLLTNSVINAHQLNDWYVPNPPETKLEFEKLNGSVSNIAASGQSIFQLPVSVDDLYQIDSGWLQDAGLDPTILSPADIAIFSRTQKVPTKILGQADTKFSAGSRIIFYGLGNDSEETVIRNYYVVVDESQRQQMQTLEAPKVTDESNVQSQYQRTYLFEEDLEFQTKLGAFLSIEGLGWVWRPLIKRGVPEAEQEITFDLIGLPFPVPSAEIEFELYYARQGIKSAHELSVTLNGQEIDQKIVLTNRDETFTVKIPEGVLKNFDNNLLITHKRNGAGLENAFIDRMIVRQNSLFRSEDGRLLVDFSTNQSTDFEAIELIEFQPYQTVALDITEPEQPQAIDISIRNNTAFVFDEFTTSSQYLLLESYRIEQAPAASKITNFISPADFSNANSLIISHEDFLAYADLLAVQHKEDGVESAVINVQDIYNYNNNGELSTASIRNFLLEVSKPNKDFHTVVLVGDCTSDGRGVARNDVVNYVPTYSVPEDQRRGRTSFASDAYYSWLYGDDQISDLFVGRVSVNNIIDAESIVTKLETVRNQQFDDWQRDVFVLSDADPFYDHTTISLTLFPEKMNFEHLDLGDEIWEDNFYLPEAVLRESIAKVSPIGTRRIMNAFEDGKGMIIYYGHGSPNIWSNQRVWFGGDSENSDNRRLLNGPRFPFLASFTCNNGAIDYPIPRWNITIIEDMMRMSAGGICGAFVPSAPGFPAHHMRMNEGLYRILDLVDNPSHGILAEAARLKYQSIYGETDHSMMYLLLGDPTIALPTGDTLEPENQQKIVPATKAEHFSLMEVEYENESTISVVLRNRMNIEQDLEYEFNVHGGKTYNGRINLPPFNTEVIQIVEPEGFDKRLIYDFMMIKDGYQFFSKSGFMIHEEMITAGDYDENGLYIPNQNQHIYFNSNPNQNLTFEYYYDFDPDQLSKLDFLVLRTMEDGTIEQTRTARALVNAKGNPVILSVPKTMNWIDKLKSQDTDSILQNIQIEILDTSDQSIEPEVIYSNELSFQESEPFDLEFVQDSLEVTPNHNVEGATVFVSATVKNIGEYRSVPLYVNLYEWNERENEKGKKLDGLVKQRNNRIPALEPDQTFDISYRWDPDKNADDGRYALILNEPTQGLESDFSNNIVFVDYDMKTKWDLRTGPIRVEKSETVGFLDLYATVQNYGETAAQNVEITFFSSQEQTDETQIGTVGLDKVEPQTTNEILYKWDIRGLDPNMEIRPSFYIALRGSMQRVSSLTD